MASIPTAEKMNPAADNGYPKGLGAAINKSYVPKMNMDTEVKTESAQTRDTLKYGIPRIALGAFTELAAAMPGISDEDAGNIAQSFTPDSIYKDFLANKEGSQTLGAIGLAFVPILGTAKLMRSEKLFKSVTKILGSRGASILLPSKVSTMDKLTKFKEEALIMAGKQQVSFTAETASILNRTGRKAIQDEVLDTFKIGLGTDIGIYAVANESNFLFPEEMSAIEIAAFYGIPNVVISGAFGAATRYKLKNILRDTGIVGEAARNKVRLPINDVMSRGGKRGTMVTTFQAQKNIKESEFARATGDSVLEQNVNSQKVELEKQIDHQLDLMAGDTPINGVTKKVVLNDAEKNTLRAGLKDDYAMLMESVSLESAAVRNPQEVLTAITKRKDAITKESDTLFEELKAMPEGSAAKLKASKQFDDLINEQQILDELTPVKINIDGSMQLVSNAKPVYEELSTGIIRQNSNAAKIKSTTDKLAEGQVLKTVDTTLNTTSYSVKVAETDGVKVITAMQDMKLILPDGVKYSTLSFKGQTAAQFAIKKSVENFKIEDNLLNPLKPTLESHHTELDGMLEVADKFGLDNPALQEAFRFNYKGIKNFDDLEFASLGSKYQDFTKQMDVIGKQKTGVIKVSEFDKLKIEDVIKTLNLPNDGTTGFHPVAQMFSDLYLNRVVKLSDKYTDVKNFKDSLAKSVTQQSDIGMFIDTSGIKLRGSAYTDFGQERKPVYAMLKSRYDNPVNREDLVQAAMQERMTMVDGLAASGDKGAPMIAEMTAAAIRDQERFNVARQVSSLVDGSMRSKDRFFTSTFSAENQAAILAVDAIRNEQDNVWRSYAAAQFKPHEQTFNRILSNDNTGDLLSFNIFVNQQGRGWRGLPDLVPVEQEGKVIGYKVALEKHPTNDALFQKTFNSKEVPEELFMPAPSTSKTSKYEPLVISPLAAEGVLAINTVSQNVLKHVNQLRELSGRPAIPAKALHMPAKNLAGKELVYLINKNTGELSTVKSGNTAVQANNLAQEEIDLASKQGVDLFIATEKTVENFKMLQSETFARMTDFSTPFNQTGAAKGTSFGNAIEIGPEVLTRMQESMINQYATISKVTSSMIFAPQFKAAEMSALTSGAGTTTLKKGETIWNTWMNRAQGKRSSNNEQVIGKFYGAAEDLYDGLVQKIWDSKVGYFKGAQTQGQAASNYDALNNVLPDYNPFKDSVDFLENTMKIKAPNNMIKHMSKLNNLMGLSMLRMFNVGLALVNIGTLPTLIAPVTKALARQKGQSLDEWKKMNAAWSSTIGDDVAIWNPTRAFNTGIQFMFSDEWSKIAPQAAKKGHLWQKAVEELQLYTAPAQGYNERMIKKYAELSSSLVDKTETWSRTISYATFFNLGKKNLKLGDDAAMDFAHQMANRVIGDFRPNVRPQMYQGAVGMPFSLFTTFALNYMQRVFGYVEKGQMKAFMNQMGLQTAFFGAKSLPGFNQYVDAFTDNYDGSSNMVDRLQSSFGTGVTDAILNGSVGTLTGLSVSTKTGIPVPFSNYRGGGILSFAPAASMIEQTYGGISDSIKSIYANEGFNGRQLSEIASRAFPIRNMQGWFDVANGMDVDRRGQVIDADINNTLDIFSRVSNIRTIRNQKVVEEFARQRDTDLRQRDIRQQMRLALRSSFRAGTLDGDFINTMAKGYVKSGGEPAGFKSFLKSQVLEGLVDKSFARAVELATKSGKEKEYMRMMEIISEE